MTKSTTDDPMSSENNLSFSAGPWLSPKTLVSPRGCARGDPNEFQLLQGENWTPMGFGVAYFGMNHDKNPLLEYEAWCFFFLVTMDQYSDAVLSSKENAGNQTCQGKMHYLWSFIDYFPS